MKIILLLKKIHKVLLWINSSFRVKEELGKSGKNSIIEYPVYFENPQRIFVEENTRIRKNVTIINSPTESVIIKKYSVIAAGVTIITNSHRSTVSIPQVLLGASHINDKSKDVVIEEDVWIGANATILAGVRIGRGAIVGACALVTKDVPPYTLVVGFPAKVVAKEFDYLDIIKHEKELYDVNERLSENFLDELINIKYKNFKIFGCNNPLSKEEKERILSIKKNIKFI